MSEEKRETRLDAIGQRMKRGGQHEPERTGKKGRASKKWDRVSLYLSTDLLAQVDAAFKLDAHDLFPQEVNKAEYLDACLTVALAHRDEIRAALAEGKP